MKPCPLSTGNGKMGQTWQAGARREFGRLRSRSRVSSRKRVQMEIGFLGTKRLIREIKANRIRRRIIKYRKSYG